MISRRKFIKTSGLTAGSFIFKSSGNQADKYRGRVYFKKNDNLIREADSMNERFAGDSIDSAVSQITGITDPSKAWKHILRNSKNVAIKVSCLPGKKLSTSTGLVKAVIKRIVDTGIEKNKIVIWERSDRELKRAGYRSLFYGCRVAGTDNPFIGGYSRRLEYSKSVGTFFSNLIYMVDTIINMPVVKDHDLSGVSCGMKNFYGAIYNPNKFHLNNCNPYIAHLNLHSLIRDKVRLIICDASRLQIHNGPAYYKKYCLEYGGLLVGADPVAVDKAAWELIEIERKKFGLKSLKEEEREPKYIKTAEDMGLGLTKLELLNTGKI